MFVKVILLDEMIKSAKKKCNLKNIYNASNKLVHWFTRHQVDVFNLQKQNLENK